MACPHAAVARCCRWLTCFPAGACSPCRAPPAASARDVYSLVPEEAHGSDGEFWGVEWCPELGKYLAPFVMQVRGWCLKILGFGSSSCYC